MTALDLGPRIGRSPHDVLRYVLDLEPGGIAVEFGVASGTTLRMIAQLMPVYGFDSFEGLPEHWRDGFPAGMFACTPPDVPGATIVPGLFADTLPQWTPPSRIGLLHVDCDLYTSTVTVFDHLGLYLREGTVIVFDEFHGYPGAEDHEQKAWAEFVEASSVEYEVLGHGPEQLAVRIR